MARPRIAILALALAPVALAPLPRTCPGAVLLADVTAETGIGFQHTDGSSGRRYIVETVSAGLALFDYNGDGLIDIYFLNGAPLDGAPPGAPPRNALYRNEGGWRFTDVTEEAGVGDTGYGLGVAVADYDNDGDPDLYLNNHGPNVLYRNTGRGTFEDVTDQAGVANGNRTGAGTCFLDMDRDGDADLYVANYLDFSYDKHVTTTTLGYPVYANPRFYAPVPDVLYRNNGDGTFTDVSAASGVGEHASWGMGMVCADFDNDRDTDVFVANDVAENFLFRNDGTGRFEEVAVICGCAFDLHGDEQGSMGAECADFDNDGFLDLYVTSYQRQLATLYRNVGGEYFEDVTLLTGAGAGTLQHVTWGTGLVDFDNDGDRDIFVACGHLQDNVELWDSTSSYLAPNLLLVNTGDGKFVDLSSQAGSGMRVQLSSRGAGFDDLDNDGDVDVVILNSRDRPTLLRNDSAPRGHWLELHLRGTRTNRDGIGARVRVSAGGLTLVDEVHSGRSYQSHYGSRLHFGLGGHAAVERVEIHWIGGGTDVFTDLPGDRLLTLVEGAGRSVAARDSAVPQPPGADASRPPSPDLR